MSKITRDDIVCAARGWIGTPYRHQASLKGVGTDCLGLVRGVWRELFGAEPERVPPYGPGWAEEGGVEALAAAAGRHAEKIPCAGVGAGDLVLFRWRPHLPAKHAGIAVSATHMVHAQDHAVVAEVPLTGWWRRHMSHAFRFPGVDD
ncbi:MAG TPA: NlpC/P60 family protein [Aestuariivirga sp.]|nr:NlpC/P60 family protein [Aestuariivirga sp.]